jgi:beta-N-acetylhexosaminidase
VNFAPIADVNNNPRNPVINIRSYGEDPARVAALVGAYVAGAKDGGMIATVKHFPGHGDTDVDSHVGLPVVRADMDRLRAIELKPFAAAIGAGVDLVMSAHIALPALGGDSTTPATLRPDVMHALLRDTLGFRGIAITDALSMQGIGKGFGIDEAVVKAVQAGTDILLRPVSGDQHANDVSRALDAVLAGIQRGDLTQARIDSSVQRILWLKARLGIVRQRFVSTDSLRAVVATAAHKALSQDVAQRSLTLIRDSANFIPLAANSRVAIVNYMPETELKASRAFAKEFTRLHPASRVVAKVTPTSLTMQLDSVAKLVKNADVVVIATYVRRVEGEGRNTIPPLVANWIDSLSTQPNVAVVSFGNPYSIRQFPHARVYLNAYGVGDVLEISVARALNGAAPIGGKSPVSLPGFFKLGDGLTR